MNPDNALRRLAESLRTDPAGFVPRMASALRERLLPIENRARAAMSPQARFLAHYGVHRSGNAGDTALFATTRLAIETVAPAARWRLAPVRLPATARDIDTLNHNCDGVIVGGGGLIIADSVRASRSGWQWNIALEDLRRLQAPLVLFAVGYNRFHGQDEFAPGFREHINATVRKAAFVGLRNRGSMRALADYLEPELASRLRFQPCPTTVLSKLLPAASPEPQKIASLNLAFDRSDKRFSAPIAQIVGEIAEGMRWLATQGWSIVVAVHDPRDRHFLPLLREAGLAFSVRDLANAGFGEILRFYRGVALTVGMRGHGQMVPFGLGNAIFTLASHPKMNYFLEDIGCPQWGVSVREPGFRDALIEGLRGVSADLPAARARIGAAQDQLWQITRDNLGVIAGALRQD